MEDYLYTYIFLRCKKLVWLRNSFRTVLKRKQGEKMSEGLLKFPKHHTRGFRWPWGKSWCLGHLPAASLAACSLPRKNPIKGSLPRKNPMKGHQSKRESEWGWERAVHRTEHPPGNVGSITLSVMIPNQITRAAPVTATLPCYALSDCKHFNDFHFQKYYINNSGTWNVL